MPPSLHESLIENSRSLTRRHGSLYAAKDVSAEEASDAKEVTATKIVKTTKIPSKKNIKINDTQQQQQQQQRLELLSNQELGLSCRIHCTITLLRKHFSSLLELPSLSSSTAKWIYDSNNVTVVGPRGEQLAVGIEEVIGINRALAISATAARRAGSLLDSLAVSGGAAATNMNTGSSVECELMIDPNNQLKVLVLWKTRLPNAEFSGRSIVHLSSQSGLVTNLQIEQVKVNGVPVIDSLGTALATLRSASRSASTSIFDSLNSATGRSGTGNPLFDGILSGLQDVVDAVEALPSEKEGSDLGSPLFVLPETLWKNTTSFVTTMKTQTIVYRYQLMLTKGRLHWLVQSCLLNMHFFKKSDETSETIRSIFSTEAEFIAKDKDGDEITLLRGGGKIADFYRSLSVLRGASGGDWRVSDIGTDMVKRYDGDIEEIVSRCLECMGYFSLDGSDESFIPLKVNRIESLQLTVAGARVDSEWAKSFVSAALRIGVVGIPDPTITELLRSLTAPKQNVKTSPKKVAKKSQGMPPLADNAASAFYGIIRSLHNDLPSIIAETEMIGPPQTPAGEFLADSIELRGLLGEVLIRGSDSYSRLFGAVISSLRAAMKTNRVRLAAKPKPTIEITPDGSIKMNLNVALWIDAPSFPGQPKSSNGGFGVPLKIEITSLYKIDETGKISEHQILESRLNGMLTPGDVFSKWIKGLTSSDQGNKEDIDGLNFASSFIDAIGWVRSQSRK
ncbi:hypothetical protein QTG54_009514 [Skeletonema marinoi]|uniref:Uncharacterized protein n=1 Tax=Skeletonema marinoi TaxID=267567 RepID=A0AAD9DBJ3_9STRA|nr:hypothetical protein QTG54_009514 [Skeletonema marinoi]